METLVDAYQVELCVMMSSLASLLGGLGFAAYAAGNRYMDGFVQQKFADGDSRWVALNWDGTPAMMLETVEVTIRRFDQMDEDFVAAQGEFRDLAH